MSRVNVWIIAALAALASTAHAHSCHEVKTAFQLRQIGPLKWVPEVPATDVDLSVCKYTGPSCCTRRMEESYRAAVLRDTNQNIKSYSFEMKYLITEHATSFQDTFQSLLVFSQNHLFSLFESTYSSLLSSISPHILCLFTDLSRFLHGTANVSVETAVHCFFDSLFPLVHTRILNPDVSVDQLGDCLRMTRQDVNPFGPHPQAMAEELARALRSGRVLSLALSVGSEVINITEKAELSKDCARALVRMHYCSHCRGLTLIRACGGYCLNVMRGCLAGLAELHHPWRRYITVLQDLSHIVAGAHNLELALLGIRAQVEEAILYAQLHEARITATVDKVCGRFSNTSSSTIRSFPATPPANRSQEAHGADKVGMLGHLHREFMSYISRYKSFFSVLPEALCEGEMGVDELTCWSGDDVVESYSSAVVGHGVRAQRQNPEVRVRGVDPLLLDVKHRLELFNTEIQEIMPGVGHRESWEDTGSGESSGECDDEDGCEGSGGSFDTSQSNGSKHVVRVAIHDSAVTQFKPSSAAAAASSSAIFILLILALGLMRPFI